VAAIDADAASPATGAVASATSVDASFDAGAGDAAVASLAALAETCLADPACPATEASRLFVSASDAHDPSLDCLRFLDGAGTPRDPARGRACLERESPSLACHSASPSLDLAELSLMRADGVGGPTDAAGAAALFADCFEDVTKMGVMQHLAAKAKDPGTPAPVFCRDIGGTTLTSNECSGRETKNQETARALAAKGVVAGLDDTGRTLFAASQTTYAAYVKAVGDFVYEVYREGSIRNSMALSTETALEAARAKDLGELPRFVAAATSAKDVEAARRAETAALARVRTSTADEKRALQKTQQTWAEYRDAEVALYVHAFGPKQGADRVRAAVTVRLESRRAKECAPPTLGQ